MADYVEGKALRKLLMGNRVDKSATALPSSTSGSLFTIAGGRVLMTGIIGECTVAVGGANSVKLIANPTVSTAADTDLCAAVDLNTCDVGDLVTITGVASDGIVAAHAGGVGGMTRKYVVLQEGTLQVNTTATTDGTFKWTLYYVPDEDGGYVVSA